MIGKGDLLLMLHKKKKNDLAYGRIEYCCIKGKTSICVLNSHLNIMINGKYYSFQGECQKSLYDEIYQYMHCVIRREHIDNLESILKEIQISPKNK